MSEATPTLALRETTGWLTDGSRSAAGPDQMLSALCEILKELYPATTTVEVARVRPGASSCATAAAKRRTASNE